MNMKTAKGAIQALEWTATATTLASLWLLVHESVTLGASLGVLSAVLWFGFASFTNLRGLAILQIAIAAINLQGLIS